MISLLIAIGLFISISEHGFAKIPSKTFRHCISIVLWLPFFCWLEYKSLTYASTHNVYVTTSEKLMFFTTLLNIILFVGAILFVLLLLVQLLNKKLKQMDKNQKND